MTVTCAGPPLGSVEVFGSPQLMVSPPGKHVSTPAAGHQDVQPIPCLGTSASSTSATPFSSAATRTPLRNSSPVRLFPSHRRKASGKTSDIDTLRNRGSTKSEREELMKLSTDSVKSIAV